MVQNPEQPPNPNERPIRWKKIQEKIRSLFTSEPSRIPSVPAYVKNEQRRWEEEQEVAINTYRFLKEQIYTKLCRRKKPLGKRWGVEDLEILTVDEAMTYMSRFIQSLDFPQGTDKSIIKVKYYDCSDMKPNVFVRGRGRGEGYRIRIQFYQLTERFDGRYFHISVYFKLGSEPGLSG